MPEEDLIPWSLPWLRYRIKKLGWRGLLILVVLAICVGGTYDASRGIIADQIAKIFNRPPPPLAVTAGYRYDGPCNPGGWIMPESAARAKSTEDLLAGTIDAPYASPVVNITVQGTTPAAIILRDLKIVVEQSFPPTQDVWLAVGACGGNLSYRTFDVSIAGSKATLTAVPGREVVNEVEQELAAIAFPFTVSNTDPMEFRIKIAKIDCDCAWHAELSWEFAGRKGIEKINDSGRPFRTTNLPRLSCVLPESGLGPTQDCELLPGL